MSTIRINNNSYTGKNISIVNGRVKIDGKDVTPDGKEINIKVEGNIEELSVDACEKVEVTGSVGELTTMAGDVSCANVDGGVKTQSGDVTCSHVGGGVSTMSGDVTACGDIKGGVSTMSGDIKYK